MRPRSVQAVDPRKRVVPATATSAPHEPSEPRSYTAILNSVIRLVAPDGYIGEHHPHP